jgi:glycosyltransferase involved in cell wall biosynthesis
VDGALLHLFGVMQHGEDARSGVLPPLRRSYRVLYHHRTQDLDGQRVHILEVQAALRRAGHVVVEVAPVRATEAAGSVREKNWKRDLLVTTMSSMPRGLYECFEWAYNLIGYRALSKAIRQIRPDFIYERYSANTIAGVWAAKKHGIPLLLEVNSPLADEKRQQGRLWFFRIARALEGFAFRNATRVLVVTEALKAILIERAGLDPQRVLVIHNGVRPQTFDRSESERAASREGMKLGQRPVIGSVAFFLEWHGLDRLLECISRDEMLRGGVDVLLVGDGPAVPRLKQMAASAGLEGYVRFTGSVPHDSVPALLSAMDIVVLPKAQPYASPLKLFEYLAAGKAIVAPRQSNFMEVLTEGVDALCFSPDDADELRRTLRVLVQDDDLRQRLGTAARETIQQRGLTWEANADRIIEAFEQIDGKRASAPAYDPASMRMAP